MSERFTVERLYALLPAVYRVRDEQSGGPLRELLDVIGEQVAVLEDSLDQFYDDQFIEVCAEWVAPYIGDLVGYRPLYGIVPRVASPRADLANTIRYRRRKGTATMLEQVARDVTGWPARAVEFFELLAATQHMNHSRPGRGGSVDLRHPVRLEWTGTAFDDGPRTADVRRMAPRGYGSGAARHNVSNVGIFLWRVAAVPLTRSPLAPADSGGRRFRFDPLGTDRPLYGAPRTEEDIAHLAEPLDVPVPLSRRWLGAHLDAYYGRDRSVLVDVEGGTTPTTVRICDLSDTGSGWAHEPAPGSDTLSIDPVLGRACFSDPVPPPPTATALGSVHYGAAVLMGGGGYDRGPAGEPATATVAGGASLQAALNGVTGGGVVEVSDSWRYPETPVIAADAGARVTLRSANRHRPLILAGGPVRVNAQPGATVILDGLLIAGGPIVLEESADTEPRTLVLRHCTLVPGLTRTPTNEPSTPDAASLIVLHPFANVTLERCIVGPIVAVDGAEVAARDCVLDATLPSAICYAGRPSPTGGGLRTVTGSADLVVGDGLAPGAALRLDESTVVGRVHAGRMDISNSILVADVPATALWLGPVWARRRQVGCIRFSCLPPGSRTPRQYRCQPIAQEIRPHFTSLRYGDPGYAQIRLATPDAIRRGADDEGEMGAAHHLNQPQRETNLRLRLDEYLRFGLAAAAIYAN